MGFIRKKKFWVGLLALSLISAALFIVVAAVWVWTLDVSKVGETIPEPSEVYDRNGQSVSRLSSSRIEPVPLGRIPVHLQDAIVVTEDRRFYEHKGVDLESVGRALWRDLRSREFAEGGSTITQQLAKNLFLPSDKTLSRKLKEAGYALKIDLSYDKNRILELYLNSIFFGQRSWGVQNAAKAYFDKPVENLTLEECALLAGLPKAPSYYNPYKNKQKALERRNLVLALMREQNLIGQEEYQKAKAMPIRLAGPKDSPGHKYPSYVDYVMQEAFDRYGFTEEQIMAGGLRIYTALDPKVQDAAEAVYREDRFFPESKPDQLIQSGTVILDQKTGEIRGMVGYRGDQASRGFNFAWQTARQPGSAFKPLAVYGPALERGYTPETMLYDGDLDIGGYRPKDWDGRVRGQVTMREAVEKSWNIPAVWLLNEIGIDTGMDFAKRAGIPLASEDRVLGLALGGLSTGVSPLHMAQAYSVFPNLGERAVAHAIVKITTAEGNVLIEARPERVRVTTPEAAFSMTGLLENAVRNGTGKSAAIDRPVAGKTGTTELPETAEFQGITGSVAKDAWFAGYTPELTAAVWIGYDHTDKNHYLTTAPGVSAPGVVFREIMSRILKDVPVTPFTVPEGFRAVVPPNPDRDDRPEENKKGDREEKEREKHEEKKEDKDKHDEDQVKERGHGKGHGKGKKD